MITKLTKKQINKFPKYVAEWTAKGLTTERQTLENAIIDFGNFQKLVLKKEKIAPVVILDSPSQCWLAVCIVANVKNLVNSQVWSQVRSQVLSQVESQVQSQVASQVQSQVESQVQSQVNSQVWSQVQSQVGSVGSQVRSQVESQVDSQVWSQVWSQVQSQVWSQVWSQVGSQVESQVRSQVESQVWSQVDSQIDSQVQSQVNSQVRSQVQSQVDSQVRSQVESQVQSQVNSQVRSQVESQVDSQVWSQVWSQVQSQVQSQVWSQVGSQDKSFIYPYFDCQFWAGWFSFFEFMRNELGILFKNEKEYESFKSCQKYGMVFPLDELCIVCQPPTIIKKNNNGLHCENGPALSYNGDNEIYALNGVAMNKEHIMTSAENITAKDVMKETNVEIRRELLRKVGIEKLLNDLPHKVLDKVGNYELYSLDLSDELKNCKYLKMTNPSIGVFHLEGVEPSINSVSEALNWRNNNMFENAEILT